MIRKVLIVEDDRDLNPILKELLTAHGFECKLASDGIRATSMLQAESFHAIISDWKMPKMDVLQLWDWLVHQKTEILFIMMTANLKTQTLEDLQAKNKNFKVLPKPFKMDELINLLKSA